MYFPTTKCRFADRWLMWNVYLPRYAIESRYVLCHALPCEGTVELSQKGDMVLRTTDIVLKQNYFSSSAGFTDFLVGNGQAKFEDNPWGKKMIKLTSMFLGFRVTQATHISPWIFSSDIRRSLQLRVASPKHLLMLLGVSFGYLWESLGERINSKGFHNSLKLLIAFSQECTTLYSRRCIWYHNCWL